MLKVQYIRKSLKNNNTDPTLPNINLQKNSTRIHNLRNTSTGALK